MAYTLTGQYVHGNGAPRRGRVKFTPSVAIAGDATVILPSPLTVDLDSGGSFSVPLVGTDDDAYSPSGWVWSCVEVLDGGRTFSFELTADADIHSLAPIAVPDDDYVTMVPVAREVVAGAGLTGGGSLNADRTFDVGAGVGITVGADDVAVVYGTTAGTAAQGNDSRLSDARTPTAHASSHGAGQSDAITVELSQVSDAGGAAALEVGTTTGTVAAGDDGRLSDARTPTAHAASHGAGQADEITVAQSQVTGLDTALAAKMSNTIADANSVLYAVTDDTPAALVVAEQRIVGRKAGGNVAALTAAEVLTLTGAAPAASPTFTGNPTAPTPLAGDADTSIATTAWAAERATVGNLLTDNQASLETDLTGLTTLVGTIARVADGVHGSYCVEVARGSDGNYGLGFGDYFPMAIGTTVTVHGYYKQSAARLLQLNVIYRDTGGAALGSVATTLDAAGSTTWKQFSHTWQVPSTWPTATQATIELKSTSGLSGETTRFDALGVWAGAGGDWAMPGTPITNQGRRVTHPNGDDVLAQQWDSTTGRWQTVRADSGRRALALSNSWTATTKALRRCDEAVELVLVGLNGASASSGIVVTLDAAFRPPYAVTFGIGTTAAGLPAHVVTVNADGTVVVGGTYASVTAGSAILRFMTAAAWPSSLPGTLVSAAAPA